jgi:hypothetical protein
MRLRAPSLRSPDGGRARSGLSLPHLPSDVTDERIQTASVIALAAGVASLETQDEWMGAAVVKAPARQPCLGASARRLRMYAAIAAPIGSADRMSASAAIVIIKDEDGLSTGRICRSGPPRSDGGRRSFSRMGRGWDAGLVERPCKSRRFAPILTHRLHSSFGVSPIEGHDPLELTAGRSARADRSAVASRLYERGRARAQSGSPYRLLNESLGCPADAGCCP